MPYHIGEEGSHDCKGFPVVKDSDGTVMGCHKTKEDAKKQLAALYANEPEASKEKTNMAMDYATSYAEIVKYDKNDDGTLMVFGKATDDTLDLDSQICDPKWLDTAMPQWFKSGGNIREMHGPSAAGVAKEYEAKNDGHYIGVHVVDPIAAKKVETGVYQGFSIGIKSPRVIRDVKAANGRIVDGQIIEVSLVDRPANPSAKLILAKAVEGETSLIQVEELHEYKAPLPSDVFKSEKGSKMETIKQITELAKSLNADSVKFDKAKYEEAMAALADLISIEASEIKEGHDETYSISHLLEAIGHLKAWYEGEEAEGEVVEEIVEEKAANDDEQREIAVGEKCDKCGMAMKECKCADKEADSDEEDDAEKSADADATVETVEEVVAEVVAEEATEEVSVTEEVADETPSIEDVVEKAVKSAMESVKAEIDTLRAEKELAVKKSVELETELATALSKSVAGGPKRMGNNAAIAVSNEYLVKAITYKAKADATTDPVLAKGYRDLHDEFLAKANGTKENK